MFPYSANTTFYLLSISSVPDEIGSKQLKVTSKKAAVGMLQSITASEYQTSVSISKKLDLKLTIQLFIYGGEKYALIKDKIYKIERTYINGMFIELYLSLSEINKDELIDD